MSENNLSAPTGTGTEQERIDLLAAGDFFREESGKKKRTRRKDMTPEQKSRRKKKNLIVTGCVAGVLVLFFAICSVCSFAGYKGNFDFIDGLDAADYQSPYTLSYDETAGYYAFTATDDSDFRVLQFTDVHLGAGAFSANKDRWALEAVSEIVCRVKPDLVVVTGDIAYPVPFQAGTLNNKREAEMFASLMEKLGVYWTLAFGNHDTEIYSLYDREDISNFYEDPKWTRCLFRRGPENLPGYGNDMIIVKDKNGKIIHSVVTVDSHSYTDGDYFGIAWKYDNIKDEQVNWYASEIDRLTKINADNGMSDPEVKNTVYFHIPLTEYGFYWSKYRESDSSVKYLYGVAGEKGEKSYPGVDDCNLFETMITHNGIGTFCGHDHYNTYALEVTAENGRKIRLTYGMSIDYLAYAGIADKIEQRGGTEIKISQSDGTFVARHRPYRGDSAEGGTWN